MGMTILRRQLVDKKLNRWIPSDSSTCMYRYTILQQRCMNGLVGWAVLTGWHDRHQCASILVQYRYQYQYGMTSGLNDCNTVLVRVYVYRTCGWNVILT